MHGIDDQPRRRGSALLATYDAQAAPCLRLARALLQDPDAAEAVAADVFLSLWQDLRTGGAPAAHVALARTLLACSSRQPGRAGPGQAVGLSVTRPSSVRGFTAPADRPIP